MARSASKKLRFSFILSQMKLLQANIPGITEETIKLSCGDEYFIRESELEAFDAEAGFEASEILKNLGLVKQGGQVGFGGERLTRINSLERILQVANNPDNQEEVDEIKSLLDAALEIRTRLSMLIDNKAQLSIALKNKKKKSSNADEEVPAEETEAVSEDSFEDQELIDNIDL